MKSIRIMIIYLQKKKQLMYWFQISEYFYSYFETRQFCLKY